MISIKEAVGADMLGMLIKNLGTGCDELDYIFMEGLEY
jgi:hypothetical protein